MTRFEPIKKDDDGYGTLKWGLAGILLAIPPFVMSALSAGFAYNISNTNKPIVPVVVLMMASGAIYLLVVLRLKVPVFNKRWFAWVIVAGLLARLSMVASTPILEDDHYRYLWDGGVLANGFNPYGFSPQDVLRSQARHIPDELRQLAREAAPIPQRINYPWLRTIYPPVAEFAFALAHTFKPWSLAAWRLVLLGADLVTFYILFVILRRTGQSLMGLVIYWWNPLLIKEIYNSGHMDVIIFPFVLGALFFTIRRRHVLACAGLGMAVGAKFWPALLLPIIVRSALSRPKILFPAVLSFLCLSIAAFLPFLLSGLASDSGFTAYGKHWEMNDALFMLLLWSVQYVMKLLSLGAGYDQLVTRALVGCLLLLWTLFLVRRDTHDPTEISRRFLLVTTALFLLSPTQLPWYALWILPFLAIYPRVSLLLLTPLLSLYYLRFYFGARGMVQVHDNGVVWLEFLPVWGLLLWERYKERKNKFAKTQSHKEGL